VSRRQRYLLRRAGSALLIAFLAISFSFVLFRALPGDAVQNIADIPNMPPEAKEAIRAQFGLDESMLTQYGLFLKELVKGNLGTSFRTQQPVLDDVLTSVRNTIPMVGIGVVVAILIGTLIGVNAAYRQGTPRDRVITGAAMVLFALPAQWLALLLLVWFSGVGLPTSGMKDPWLVDPSFFTVLVDRLKHMVLPSGVMVLVIFGAFALVVRSSQLDALTEDHVLTARAKGYGNRRVIWREAFRSAMLPLVTLTTMTLGWVIAGALLVESVFSWPGVGMAILQAVGGRDYPMLQGLFLLITVSVVFFNFLGDVLHAVLDPRVAE
jgi:ABC-type dipeptide/oligopeptide/nickel transport system permease component